MSNQMAKMSSNRLSKKRQGLTNGEKNAFEDNLDSCTKFKNISE